MSKSESPKWSQKNPADRTLDWEDGFFSYVVRIVKRIIVALQGESPNKLSYQIRNPLITVALPGKHMTILYNNIGVWKTKGLK
jgi:hypothetical protein